MRTSKIYCLSNVCIYNAVLLTIVTVLDITSPELIYLIYLVTESLYFLTNFIQFPSHLPLESTSLLCLYVCLCFFFFFKILCIREIIQYLSFSIWFVSLSIISSRSIFIAENGRISFFVMGEYYSISYMYHSYLSIYLLMDSWVPSICWLL